MKNKSLLAATILFILFHVNAVVYAQQNPRTLFAEGKQAFEQEEYVEAYNKFTEVLDILGEPKMRLQPWLVKSAFELRLYYGTNQHLKDYFAFDPDQNLIEYQEMTEYSRQVQYILRQSNSNYQRIININNANQFIKALQRYGDKYQDGPLRDKLIDKLGVLDQKTYDNINRNNINSINNYLNLFAFKINDDLSKPGYYFYWTPSNKEEALKLKDDYLFNETVQQGTLRAYNDYLYKTKDYAQDENYRKVELLKDDYLFNEAKKKGTKYAYRSYLRDNDNFRENRNYEKLEKLLEELKNKEKLASLEDNISHWEETLSNYRGKAFGGYVKGILSLALVGVSGYYANELWFEKDSEELTETEEYISIGLGVPLALGTIWTIDGFKKGGKNSGRAKRAKRRIKELENDVRQISLAPIINPVNQTYGFQLAIKF